MDAYYSKITTPANAAKAFTTKYVQVRNLTDESDGFCICPNCFHFVFDESLTGVCPSCRYKFCPSCSVKKRKR
ncbi:MAG: hypothetical protein ACYSU8_05340 [Planctomycetota bacterium]